MTNVRATHEDAGIVFGKQYNMVKNFRSLTKLIAGINKPILFFNVGTPDINGDAYGPMLGTLLQKLGADAAIMGTEADPIHATNIVEKIEKAKLRYPNHVVIATDAAVGLLVGNTRLQEGMLQAGAGVSRMLPPVGDYVLTCATALGTTDAELNITRLTMANRNTVRGYAAKAAAAITLGLSRRNPVPLVSYTLCDCGCGNEGGSCSSKVVV